MFKNLQNYFVLIIIAIIPLIIAPGTSDYFYHPKISVVYFLCALMMLYYFRVLRQMELKLNALDYILTVYLFILVLSTLFSVDIVQAVQGGVLREEGLLAIICYIFIYLIASKYYIFSKRHVKYFIFSVSTIAVYGIFQFYGYDFIKSDYIRANWQMHSFSTIGNRNFLGSLLVLALPISIFAYSFTKKVIYLITSCILYLCLLCTLTRSAWIGFTFTIILLAVYIVKYKINVKSFFTLVLLFVVISIGFNISSAGSGASRVSLLVSDLEETVTDSSKDTGSHRIFIWEKALNLIKERPILGSGPDTFGIIFSNRFGEDANKEYGRDIYIDKAHNEYLQIAAATGIPALAAYISFGLLIIIKSIKNISLNKFIIPVLCSIIGYSVQAFFNISVVSVAPVFWAFLGITVNFSGKAIE